VRLTHSAILILQRLESTGRLAFSPPVTGIGKSYRRGLRRQRAPPRTEARVAGAAKLMGRRELGADLCCCCPGRYLRLLWRPRTKRYRIVRV